MRKALIPFARWAVIYRTTAHSPQLVLLPPREEWDDACGAHASPEDLDTDDWFEKPEETTIFSVDCFPGTGCYLRNGYDIIVVHPEQDQHNDGERNQAIETGMAHLWSGNMVVVKRGRFDRARAVSITRLEVSMISALVERCVPAPDSHTFWLSGMFTDGLNCVRMGQRLLYRWSEECIPLRLLKCNLCDSTYGV